MQLTSENYYSQEANQEYMSVSGYKDFAGTYGKMPCEFYGMEKLNGRWEDEKSTALLVGSYVDSYFEGSLEQFKKDNPEIFTQKGELKANFKQADDDFYDRIAAEYDNSMTYLGNDTDYKRWAKQAGAGDAIVIPVWNGPGTVKLVLVDGNGKPANAKLVQDVYNYIVSPNDRSARLLPTGTAELTCAAATTVAVNYVITGLSYDETTGIEQIKADFTEAVRAVYAQAKTEGVLRYNDVRPLISAIAGVEDFETFTMNGKMQNITLKSEEYPDTGTLNFS